VRAPRLAALAMMIALGTATACGGEVTKSSEQEGGFDPGVKAIDINPAARDQIRAGGTLRWGLGEFPAQWNANHIDGDVGVVRTVMAALLPHPFRSDERGRVTLDTDYVTAAKVTATNPRQVITYTLNPKARWTDGKPVTWEDFAAQWKALSGQDPAYRVNPIIAYENIRSVAKGKTAQEVVVTFQQPYGEWHSLFTPLYPKATNGTPAAFNADWLNRIPITAGPFKLAKFSSGDKTVTLARDTAWWGSEARLDQVVFRGFKGTEMTAAFVKGELDVADVSASPDEYTAAKAVQGAVIRQAAGRDFRHFTFNGESDVLTDVRVRQAIAMAIDRRAVAQAASQQVGWKAVPLNNHFFMNTQQGYRDNAGTLGSYDVAGAGRLLDAAGWKLAGAARTKNGKQLTLRVVIPEGQWLSASEAQTAAASLKQIGVRANVVTVPAKDFFTKHVIAGNFDLAPFSYSATPFPVTVGYDKYANGAPEAKGDEKRWYANLGRSGSPEIDEAMWVAGTTLDPAKAADSVNAADKLIWQEVNVLPLYQRPQSVAVKSTLANIGATGFYDLKFQDIGFTA
jgi:peptide/nickel transport system substrate-binding protein